MNLTKFAFDCPNCRIKATFTDRPSYSINSMEYSIKTCDNCGRVTYFIFHEDREGSRRGRRNILVELIDYYPKRTYRGHESIPSNIAEEFGEAMVCFDNKAFESCVGMCRRALQSTCKLKKAKGKNLQEQIDDIIPDDLKEYAHEIRLWGNIGAHPDDLIQDVTEESAKEIMDLIENMFEYLFIMPFKVKKSQERRNK